MHAYRPDHYEELGVPRTADAEAIRTAYRALAKQLHPDLSEGDGGDSKEAFLRLQEAYGVLSDPERRARYDRDLDRQAAMTQAAREAAHRPIRPRPIQARAAPTAARPAAAVRPRTSSPMSSRIWGLSGYLAAIGLVVIVTAGIALSQLLFPPEPPSITIVKVDPDSRGRAGRGGASGALQLPPDPGILTKDVDRAVQAQIARVEAARKQVEAQRGELEAHKAPSGNAAQPQTPAMLVPRVECSGRGTTIVLTRESGSVKVTYDNGPPVQPRISDLGTGTILVSRIEPTNRFAVAFTRGERDSTMLLMFGQTGNLQQTINVKCTVAAF
jgi:hypothetical protein